MAVLFKRVKRSTLKFAFDTAVASAEIIKRVRSRDTDGHSHVSVGANHQWPSQTGLPCSVFTNTKLQQDDLGQLAVCLTRSC